MLSLLLITGLLLAALPQEVDAGVSAQGPSEALLRSMIAEAALAQVERMDPRWQPAQRDCAGLVRFSYREAFQRLDPQRTLRGLWRDERGQVRAFADASTLLTTSFRPLGRGERTLQSLRSADLVAFRQLAEPDAEPVFHLMLVVRSQSVGAGEALVVYHSGDARGVQLRRLRELLEQAPREWQPRAANPSFLGFYRHEEWMP